MLGALIVVSPCGLAMFPARMTGWFEVMLITAWRSAGKTDADGIVRLDRAGQGQLRLQGIHESPGVDFMTVRVLRWRVRRCESVRSVEGVTNGSQHIRHGPAHRFQKLGAGVGCVEDCPTRGFNGSVLSVAVRRVEIIPRVSGID